MTQINIKKDAVFTEYVWSCEMPDHEHWKKQLKQIALVEEAEYTKFSTRPGYPCNVKALRTSWNSHLKFPAINNICNIICNDLLVPLLKYEELEAQHVKIMDSWLNIYKQDNYTDVHAHPPSFLSFVYFVKLPKKDCKFYFHNNDFVKFTKKDKTRADIKEYNAKEGMVLFFNGSTYHSVSKSETNEKRLTLAGNTYPIYKDSQSNPDFKPDNRPENVS
jgi:uncharacterized protein (TIGR02466 family)